NLTAIMVFYLLSAIFKNSPEILDTIVNALELLIYINILFSLLIITIMAFRSLALAKKTEDIKYKKGLQSFGISFILLISVIVLIVINSVILSHYDKNLETVIIILLEIAFYFIYTGFVKPAQ
ncbi:MAG: hypothetical protein ACTSVI_03370, partial [Promethearchaeota archaeon]